MKLKNVHLFIFCGLFTVVQLWFGIGGMGLEFKGSTILMAPFRFYFLNWLLLLFAVFWSSRAKDLFGFSVFASAMFLHYAVTFWYVLDDINNYRIFPDTEEGLGRVLSRYPEELVWGSISYLVGNLFIWAMLLTRVSSRHERD